MSIAPVTPAVRVLASPVRRDIMDTLANLPLSPSPGQPWTRRGGLTAAALASRLGLHVTTIRFHVDQLVRAGLLVTRDERAGVGRPRRHYAVSPGPIPDAREFTAYRIMTELLAEALADGTSGALPTAEEAGERWVRRHASEFGLADPTTSGHGTHAARTREEWEAHVRMVVDLLQRWGYGPQVRRADDGHTAEIRLVTCPLRDLATTNPAVACGVHRGLVRGTLDLLGEQDSDLKVVPFVQPNLCIARITTKTEFAPQGGTP